MYYVDKVAFHYKTARWTCVIPFQDCYDTNEFPLLRKIKLGEILRICENSQNMWAFSFHAEYNKCVIWETLRPVILNL